MFQGQSVYLLDNEDWLLLLNSSGVSLLVTNGIKRRYDSLFLFQLLMRGQTYAVSLILEMPECPENLEHGKFSVHLFISNVECDIKSNLVVYDFHYVYLIGRGELTSIQLMWCHLFWKITHSMYENFKMAFYVAFQHSRASYIFKSVIYVVIMILLLWNLWISFYYYYFFLSF